jgi:hypothetical protein
MPGKRRAQARENVTEIKAGIGEAANENSAQEGFQTADTGCAS